MICENCGTENSSEYSFCMKCGHELKPNQNKEVENLEIIEENNKPNQVIETPTQENQNINNQNNQNQPNNLKQNNNISYVKYVIDFIKQPFKTFKENESNLIDKKTSLIFSGIVAVVMMVITLLKAMIMSVFSKTYDFSSLSTKTVIDFSRLENLDYVSLIFKNLIIYVAIIAIIALVYYIVSLVMKKNTDYFKMLVLTSTSIIPFIISGMLLAPILGIIWSLLGVVATIIGAVYSLLIFINLIDDEFKLESIDKKIYFHLICLSIIGSITYYLYFKIIFGSQSSSVSNILDLFK